MGTKRRFQTKKGTGRRKSQKLYKMKGCSKKCKGGKGWKGGWKGGKKKTRGGRPKPHLFVTYTGGDVNPVATQAPGSSVFGSQTGGCGCSTSLGGGGSGGQSGGSCEGDQCSIQGSVQQAGGADALVGSSWNPASPGALPVPNHYALNLYDTDISRQMIATGAQPPFSVGGARGVGKRRRRSQKGGGWIDYPAYYGDVIKSAFAGTPMPVSPAPTEGQFASMHSRM